VIDEGWARILAIQVEDFMHWMCLFQASFDYVDEMVLTTLRYQK
jgi:hypothetical protein